MNAGLNLGGRWLLQSSDYVITATGPGRRRWKKTLVKLKKQWKKGESAVKRQQSIGEKKGKKVEKSQKPKYPWAVSTQKEEKEAKESKNWKREGTKQSRWCRNQSWSSYRRKVFLERQRTLDVIIPILRACTICTVDYSKMFSYNFGRQWTCTLWAFSPICLCLMSPRMLYKEISKKRDRAT